MIFRHGVGDGWLEDWMRTIRSAGAYPDINIDGHHNRTTFTPKQTRITAVCIESVITTQC